jgi:hypothetical protein
MFTICARVATLHSAGRGGLKPRRHGNQLDFREFAVMILPMALPTEPVTLSVEQIAELNRKLGALRHDVNNQLSLIMAAVELIRRRPEGAERMLAMLVEQPHKIAGSLTQFSEDVESVLRITKP